jgi:hypothetical protein
VCSQLLRWVGLGWVACAICACSVGQGTGSVTSDRLFAAGCWLGKFDLEPNFFGANPFANTLTIRIQRGQQDVQVSDGVTLLVNDLTAARASLGTALSLGLPVGVTPLGYPLPETPNPPAASLSLYLNDSCRSQNSLLSAVGGSVTFERLFSGNLNEGNADNRLTIGTFEAIVVDPRDAIARAPGASGPAYTYPPDRTSTLEGSFNFIFQRGTPAQPFP